MSRLNIVLPIGIFLILIFIISTIPVEAFYNDFAQSLLFFIVIAALVIILNLVLKQIKF